MTINFPGHKELFTITSPNSLTIKLKKTYPMPKLIYVYNLQPENH